MDIKDSKIAIVHDWFLKKSFGGSEKVTVILNELLKSKYSEPDVFSLTQNIKNTKKDFLDDKKIQTSFIQSLPFGKTNVQNYLPILPFAIEQIDLSEYDFILSSSHAFAKGIITSPDQLHISYIHTPMRYAWDQMNTYIERSSFKNSVLEIPLRYLLYKLRSWDFISGHRPDYLIANSHFTSRRIKKYWGLESEVIHPPVNVKRFSCNFEREDFYLSVNRLVPNKRVDLIIKAFNALKLPLVIIGDGPEKNKLKKIANSNIIFYGNDTNDNVEKLLSKCRAFVYAGIEDFGIAPVEAMASGAPVIGLGKGGLLDTVNCYTQPKKNKISTGVLFNKQSTYDIIDTINWFEDKQIWKFFKPQDLNQYAQKFNPENFKNKFQYFLETSWDSFLKKTKFS